MKSRAQPVHASPLLHGHYFLRQSSSENPQSLCVSVGEARPAGARTAGRRRARRSLAPDAAATVAVLRPTTPQRSQSCDRRRNGRSRRNDDAATVAGGGTPMPQWSQSAERDAAPTGSWSRAALSCPRPLCESGMREASGGGSRSPLTPSEFLLRQSNIVSNKEQAGHKALVFFVFFVAENHHISLPYLLLRQLIVSISLGGRLSPAAVFAAREDTRPPARSIHFVAASIKGHSPNGRIRSFSVSPCLRVRQFPVTPPSLVQERGASLLVPRREAWADATSASLPQGGGRRARTRQARPSRRAAGAGRGRDKRVPPEREGACPDARTKALQLFRTLMRT